MYNVIVADDEQNILEAIVDEVPWQSLGFNVVGQACNGAEALELVEKLAPDVVITDIKMPFITGIELAGELRQSYPAIDIVFLTGYDDFEYTKQAIRHNVVDYWLKPISVDEISAELGTLKEMLDNKWDRRRIEQGGLDLLEQNRLLLGDRFFNSLVARKRQPDAIVRALDSLPAGFFEPELEEALRSGGCYQLCEVEVGNAALLENCRATVTRIVSRYLTGGCFICDERLTALLCAEEKMLERQLPLLLRDITDSLHKIFGTSVTVGVSNRFDALPLVYMAFREAENALSFAPAAQDDILYISDIDKVSHLRMEYLDNAISELDKLIKMEAPEAVQDYVSKLFTFILGQKLSRTDLNIYILEIISLVSRAMRSVQSDTGLSPKLIDGLFLNNSLADIEEQVKRLCTDACVAISSQRQKNAGIIVAGALEIIAERFGDSSLSLNSLSAELHCSSNYLSSVIKKINGESFITLLTQRRMEYALERVLTSNDKIFEIAKNSGYDDHHYFSYCFKKYHGLSPNKMRENAGNEDK